MWRVVLLGLLGACGPKQSSPQVAHSFDTSSLDIRLPTGDWTPDATAPRPLPFGQWIAVGDDIAFTYLDWEQGPTAAIDGPHGRTLYRLTSLPAGARVLAGEDLQGLPATPDWLDRYGEQPPAGSTFGTWRNDPNLTHRFHADYPDDLRVLIPSDEGFEVVWVSLRVQEGDTFIGALLNQPNNAPRLHVGSLLHFSLDGVALDRLPVAAALGEEPDVELMAFAATSPRMGGMLQDDAAWEVDISVPAEERALPMNHYLIVGDTIGYVITTYTGPVYLGVAPDGSSMNMSMNWLPVGAQVLSAEDVATNGLPETMQVEGAPPQPGPDNNWGWWRTAPELAWLFDDHASEPEEIRVSLPVSPGDDPVLARAIVWDCNPHACSATLVEEAPPHATGTQLLVPLLGYDDATRGTVPAALLLPTNGASEP